MEAVTAAMAAVITGAVTAVEAVTGNSRIGRLPKNLLCSAKSLERGVQNSKPFLVRFFDR
jgi:hypothetical protein